LEVAFSVITICFSWVLFEREDMNGELAWLVQELLAAEANGELVHIISHIPPGMQKNTIGLEPVS